VRALQTPEGSSPMAFFVSITLKPDTNKYQYGGFRSVEVVLSSNTQPKISAKPKT
jgi:hypothetical protein